MTSEQEDLETLLKHPGYLRLVTYAAQEWETNLTGHLASAANDRDDLLALQKLRQVLAAQKAVQRLLAWPRERIQLLTQGDLVNHAAPSVSRRGSL